MTYKHILLVLMLAVVALSSCVDDKYDLSDIDTTVRVDVDHLVVPIKLDEIKLESIITDDKRVKVVNGRYAIIEPGEFSSREVFIPTIWVISDPIYSNYRSFKFDPAQSEYEFALDESEFQLHTNILPDDVTYIEDVTGDIELRVLMGFNQIDYISDKITLNGLQIQLPKNMTVTELSAGQYDADSGVLSIGELPVIGTANVIVIKVSRLDLNALDAKIDPADRRLRAGGAMKVLGGTIRIDEPFDYAAGREFEIRTTFAISDFQVATYTGGLTYHYEDLVFDPVDLSGMPDFLSQAGTDLKLANPCLYLKVRNPMQAYGLYSLTGLHTEAELRNKDLSYAIDDQNFSIGISHQDAIYNYCLSPAMPRDLPEGFEDAEFVSYSRLADIISNGGDPECGIPSTLEIKMDDPRIPQQHVVDMPVDQYLRSLNGTYEFHAPLALKKGSVIMYCHTATGWGWDESDDITFTQLDLEAMLTCNIPLSLEMRAYPVDHYGRKIGDVEIKGVKIDAGTAPQKVHITITGDVTGFDGVHYEALVRSTDDEQLRADMDIRLTDIRPTLSGYYQKKL